MTPESSDTETRELPLFSPLLEAAMRLAARGHYHQFRKNIDDSDSGIPIGSFLPDRVPYIAHLMGTMGILARLGVRDEVLAAGVLHDYLEDVPDPDGRDSIRQILGEDVLSLVLEVTEDKRRNLDEADTWKIRKIEQLAHIAGMPDEAVLIKAADVLHNMQSLLYDHEAAEDPESVWLPFNAGPDLQLWYFQGVVGAVEERLGDHPLARDLRSSVDRLQVCIE